MCFISWLDDWRLKRRIKQLSIDERREIIEKSPYDAAWFQGEGFHVFLKSEPDYHQGYVTSLGEISGEAAENWIIERYWKENKEI